MQTQSPREEKASLEIRLKEYEFYFNQSIEHNEVLGKTKLILHEIKRISHRIIQLKTLPTSDQVTDLKRYIVS